MSILERRVQQEAKRGISAIIYGQNGAGKSNLAGSLKNTLYVASERGFTNLNLNDNYVVEIDSFMDLLTLFGEVSSSIAAGTNTFETIVLDSISSLERQLHKFILSTDKRANDPTLDMLSAGRGYGSAFSTATK
jgi:ABC-type molybdenum transport system ATPase subunit/photorepair protein PhrA